ncbi:MAG: hypothetical protein SGI91_12245 [Alphaproteobacteria bacterium]|jgi:hypothetical protein|nr:hypothetical protein [Alphaproteobacteria bacterium]
MSWMSTTLSLGAVVGLLALAGCKTGHYHDERIASPVSIAKQACEITGLAEERDVMMSTINEDYPGEPGPTTEHRWTIMKDKLLEYRAEVEASYRFVTASCNSYNLCMENNGYNEQACSQTRQAWVSSQEKFNHLAMSLNSRPWRHHGDKGRHRKGHDGGYGYDDRCKKNDCSFGGYRGDCCYDND